MSSTFEIFTIVALRSITTELTPRSLSVSTHQMLAFKHAAQERAALHHSLLLLWNNYLINSTVKNQTLSRMQHPAAPTLVFVNNMGRVNI